jgi:hypothetical protein
MSGTITITTISAVPPGQPETYFNNSTAAAEGLGPDYSTHTYTTSSAIPNALVYPYFDSPDAYTTVSISGDEAGIRTLNTFPGATTEDKLRYAFASYYLIGVGNNYTSETTVTYSGVSFEQLEGWVAGTGTWTYSRSSNGTSTIIWTFR